MLSDIDNVHNLVLVQIVVHQHSTIAKPPLYWRRVTEITDHHSERPL